jgi:hypothetical protein
MGIPIIGVQAAQRAQKSRPRAFVQQFTRPNEGNYQDSSEFSPTPADIQQFTLWQNTGPQNYQGMTQPGNIDLSKRPLVHHLKGPDAVSTLYSMSFGPNNQQVLVPKVSPDGRMLTNQEAEDLYRKTGQHLGMFNSIATADAYANMLHLKQGAYQRYINGGKYNPTRETTMEIPPESEQ